MASFRFVCLLALLACLSEAVTPSYRVPLPDIRRRWNRFNGNTQVPFALPDESYNMDLSKPALATEISPTSTKKSTVLEVEMDALFGFPFFFTNIALGAPPQPFRVMIDLGYGGIAVRDVKCDSMECGRDLFMYNRSASSTSFDIDDRFSLALDGQTAAGDIMQDNLQLVSIPLPNVTFGAADTFYGENIGYYILADICDGALGLGPPNATSASYPKWKDGKHLPGSYPNIMYELLASRALEHKIMTMSLPQSANQMGGITLGSILDGVAFRIPLTNKQAPWRLESTWNVELQSIELQGPVPLTLPSLNLHAAISLAPDFALSLPVDLTKIIQEYLGAKPSEDFPEGVIDCEQSHNFPDLVLNLGGKDIVLTWKEYTGALIFPDGSRVCDLRIGADYFDKESAALGLALLRNFDLMFDMEHDELGFIPRK